MGKSEEALKSEDVALIKRCRSSMSTQITSDLNLLNRELSKKVDGCYNLSSINDQLVQSKKKHLNDHFELMLKLHERYVELRVEGVTEAEEQDLIQADMNYIEEIETIFSRNLCRFKMITNKVKSECWDVVENTEDSQTKQNLISTLPLDTMLRDMTDSYNELKLSSSKLAECLRATNQNENDIKTSSNIKTISSMVTNNYRWGGGQG